MNILVLGCQGFIGSHLVNYFISASYTVFGCDLIEFSSDRFRYFKLSILSADFEGLIAGQSFDYCINASGSGNVPYSIAHPLSDFEANTSAVAKVLDTLRRHQPSCKYVHISSAAVYGNPSTLPITEDSVLAPISPYGWHKLMAEQLCKEYYQLFTIPIAIVRPFSIYGDGLKKQLLWDVCNKLSKHNELELFGTGKETRDFMHVEELCRAIHLIMKKSLFAAEVYNLGNGVAVPIARVIEYMVKEMPGNAKITFSNQNRPGDPLYWEADISKLKAIGYEPFLVLQAGVARFVHWYLKNYEH